MVLNKEQGGAKMIRTDELRYLIAKRGKTQTDVAKHIGIAPKTFFEKMKKGVFLSCEIDKLIDYLSIENPAEVFFAKEGTS